MSRPRAVGRHQVAPRPGRALGAVAHRSRRAAAPGRSRTLIVALAAVALVTLAWPAPPSAGAAAPARYVPPVPDAVIVDHFRPPDSVYGPGNRGLDLLTPPGAAVHAPAGGEVVFAGAVANTLHVTIRHPDGLRTTSSFLAAVLVDAGDHVEQGAVIGVSSGRFHFGVRDATGAYLDPELLLRGSPHPRLVPGPDDAPSRASRVDGAAALAGVLADAARALGGRADQLAAIAHEARSVNPVGSAARLVVEIEQWRGAQQGCTPSGVAAAPPAERRIAVLVGGLGSTSTLAAIDQLDLAALGYAPSDVVRFTYRGGRVPRSGDAAAGALEAVTARGYDAADTGADLHDVADRFLDLLAAVARAEPGVPIDIVAHSLGGVVVRLALARAAEGGALPDDLGAVVTLGTPHQGADLATAMAAMGADSPSGTAIGRLGDALGVDLDPRWPAIAQLAETSSVVAELARPVPPGVHLLSVGASGDLVVPAVRTVAAGADHAIVHLDGLEAHDRLPADAATTREIALALAGHAPTCGGAGALADLLRSHALAQAEDALGLAVASVGSVP